MGATLKIDTREFHRTRLEEMKWSKRDLSDSLNTHLFFIGLRAMQLTPSASAEKLRMEFGQASAVSFNKKTGKARISRKKSVFGAMIGDVARLAVIINARRIKRGLPVLTGKDLEKATNTVFNARLRSLGFIKSGYLRGIGILGQAIPSKRGAPPRDKKAKRYGSAKGGATIAKAFTITSASIWNTAQSKRDSKEALFIYGQGPLEQAFAMETAKMREYIERKMLARAQKLGIKTN